VAKQSGLGANFYVGGYNISGDVGSLGSISGGNAPLEVTAIDKSAFERIGGLRNGTIEFSTFYNTAALQEHVALKGLLTTDRTVTYAQGTTIGDPAACMTAKQINYDFTRAADGSLTTAVQAQSNGYGLEWGIQLTAGVRTDTGATNGASVDTTGSLSFGIQAYLQVFAFSGTDITFTVQDSANDSTFATITGLGSFTQVTAGPTTERIASTNTTTVRRYLRLATTTSGGFSSCSFSVVFVKNEIASQVF
jgi:hypothetical protein